MLYFDHASSTNIFPSILEELTAKARLFGNPSSVHQIGQDARHILDEARYGVAKSLEANLENVIFTSGATEALSLAIIGYFLANKKDKFTILVSPLSHSSVMKDVNFLVKNFGVLVRYLPIDKQGYIDIEKISETELSSVDMVICEHGNSEIGIVQPVVKLGKKIRKIESNRPKFIVDTASSVVDMEISLNRQVCDALVLSAEKFGGLKGSGVLLRDNNFEIQPLIGGSQEFGYRGGTENVLGIWAMEKALALYSKNRAVYIEKWQEYQEILSKFFVQKFSSIKITTPKTNFLPHIFHFILPCGDAHIFVQQCDLLGLCISAGSACSSGSVDGSTVLQKIGYSDTESRRGIRVSFGRDTRLEDIFRMLMILEKIINNNDF